MKSVDEYAISKIGIPSLVLMERAAYSIFMQIEKAFTKYDKILIVAGSGNNGADGVALSRMLRLRDFNVDLMIVGNGDRTSEFIAQREIADNVNINMVRNSRYMEYDLIVDGLFGVGLTREIGGEFAKIINDINTVKITNPTIEVWAIDIPSGINATNGRIMGTAVYADRTITFGNAKTGIMLYPGAECAGEVYVEDIGFPEQAYAHLDYNMFYYELHDLVKLPTRPEYSNKGTYGKILIIAGSKDMCGAAYLSAMAAYRSGAGIVRIFTVDDNKLALQQLIPEAILTTYSQNQFEIDVLTEALEWSTAIAAGPGLGLNDIGISIVEETLRANKLTVFDADALNIISRNPYLQKYFHKEVIITPHIGEMARLTGMMVDQIQSDLIQSTIDYADENKIICVQKDARTIVADYKRNIYINTFGNSGMATAGSGDVLTGIIIGIAANTDSQSCLFEKVTLGVMLHSICGDQSKKQIGSVSIMARNLIDCIEEVMEKRNDERWKN